jgi:hypothetical protein
MYEMVPAHDVSPADWVVDALQAFGGGVRSIVPAGFEAYARVFHPALGPGGPVRWSTVAEANGRIAHAAMQWPAITGTWQDDQSPLWEAGPTPGILPTDIARTLARVLGSCTQTPTRCWFAVWEGHGCLTDWVRAAPTFLIPHRRLHLFRGHVDAAVTSFCDPPWGLTANLWWPDDQAWCVATEIDFSTTYVGGSAACIAAITAAPELEAMVVEPTDGVTYRDDPLNPTPSPPY